MSKSNILEKLDSIFDDLQKPDAQKLELLVSETLKCFEYLREKLSSSDPKEKEEALEMTYQLQRKLEVLADKALGVAGIDHDQLKTLLSNPKNFSSEQWGSFERSEHAIEDYKKELMKNSEKRTS